MLSKPKAHASPALAPFHRALGVFLAALALHAYYISSLIKSLPSSPALQPVTAARLADIAPHSHLPHVFIFRRSKKTGSSSMLTAIIHTTSRHQYVPLYHGQLMMLDVVRAENLKPAPSRLLIAQHNRVTRDTTAPRRTVIADTILDGYTQVTSYCRYFEHVADCADEMVRCLERQHTRAIIHYRWAGRSAEDAATFIDLPLSSAHPALSTTVFRHVFPDATLDVQRVNSVGSACQQDDRLRAVYSKWYAQLDEQVDMLRRRMLALAGYPVAADKKYNISTVELMDVVESKERSKYKFGQQRVSKDMSSAIIELWKTKGEWQRLPSGEILLKEKGR